jgi:hypothetical protein
LSDNITDREQWAGLAICDASSDVRTGRQQKVVDPSLVNYFCAKKEVDQTLEERNSSQTIELLNSDGL